MIETKFVPIVAWPGKKTARELRTFKGFGKKSVEEVEEFLKERGLKLGMEVPE